jgi:6-phosphogluconolactonase
MCLKRRYDLVLRTGKLRLALRKNSCFIVLLFCLNLYSQKEYVFFGSYNRDKTTEGIYVYELDITTGELTKITAVNHVLNPSYLTISPDGKYVYACTESKIANAGSVSAFAFDAEKKNLTFLNSQKSGGENPVYLSVHKNGKWLINGNYTEGSVSVYPISGSGSIDSLAQRIPFTEGSITPERQERAHIHCAVFSPDFDSVLLTDLGADKIRIYPFDGTQKEPLGIQGANFIKTESGSGPRHLTFSPNGNYAYCIEEISGTICAYSFIENKLERIQRIETHPEEIKEGFESSDVHISPDGLFLYATNRGNENNIAIYRIEADGLLKWVAYQPVLGKHPRTFAIDETGKFIIVTNVVSGNVVVFKRDVVTGLLMKVGKPIAIRNVSCVKIKSY